MRPHNAQDRDLQPASLFDVHVLPPGDVHPTTFVIGPTPRAIWLAMGGEIFGLEFGSIFAWRSFFPCGKGGSPVKAAIAFEAAQDATPQSATATHQPGNVTAP